MEIFIVVTLAKCQAHFYGIAATAAAAAAEKYLCNIFNVTNFNFSSFFWQLPGYTIKTIIAHALSLSSVFVYTYINVQ